MRAVALGHWHYFLWNLPAALLAVLALSLGVAVARQLVRNPYVARERAWRWAVVGWCSVVMSLSSAIAWPYLRDVSSISVDGEGNWYLKNYLGLPLGRVQSEEVREVRAVDMGAMGPGLGHIEVRLADGHTLRTVRITRTEFESLTQTLQYSAVMREQYCDLVAASHRYSGLGPMIE